MKTIGLFLLLLLTLPAVFKTVICLEESSPLIDPLRGVWLDVPYVRQKKNLCGAACVSMIMRYWVSKGAVAAILSDDPDTIASQLYSSEDRGIRGGEIAGYLRNHGFQVYVFQGTISDLAHHLEQGRPAMVCLQPGGSPSQLHYVVIVGIIPTENLVMVNDPAQRKLVRLSRTRFEASWKAVQSWTLLALPQSMESRNINPSP